MNEQAIKDSYELFKSGGYNKSIDEFKSLIASNPQALNDSYELFKSGGYSKDLDSYKALMGLTAQPVASQPAPAPASASVQPDKKKVATALPSAASSSGSVSTRPTEPTIATRKPQATSFGTYGISKPQPSTAPFKKPVAPEPESILGPVEKDMSVSREVSMRPTQPAMPKPAAPEPTSEANDYFTKSLDIIKSDFVGLAEGEVVPKLNYTFGQYGFKFNEAGPMVDQVEVVAPDGKTKETFSLDGFMFTDSDSAEAARLRKFISDNRPKSELLAAKEGQYTKPILEDKQIQETITSLNADTDKLNKDFQEFKRLSSELEAKVSSVESMTPQQKEQFIQASNILEAKRLDIIRREQQIKSRDKSLEAEVGKYASMKGESGNAFTATRDALYGIMDDFYYGAMRGIGGLQTAVGLDNPATRVQSKALEVVPDYKDIVRKKFASESYKEYRESLPWLANAALGVIESVPAMIPAVGLPISIMQYTGQNYEDLDKADLTEGEKGVYATALAVPSAILAKMGFENAVSEKLLGELLLKRALPRIGVNFTLPQVTKIIENDVKNLMAKGLLRVAVGGAAEFESGAIEEVLDIGGKKLINALEEKEIFKTPENFLEGLKQVAEAGAAEAVGGAIIGTVSAVNKGYQENKFENLLDDQVALLHQISSDPTFIDAYKVKIKQDVAEGKMTTEEGQSQEQSFDKMVGQLRSIPDGISPAGQKEALRLLKERDTLQAKIDASDPDLVTKEKARVTEIKEKLNKISEDYAVQESGTAEGVLRNEESQVGLQEMGEGNAEGQATPQETIVQEEVTAEPVAAIETTPTAAAPTPTDEPSTPAITIDAIRSLTDEQIAPLYDEIPLNLLPMSEDVSNQDAVYEAYYRAKRSGKYPELVSKVEEIIISPPTPAEAAAAPTAAPTAEPSNIELEQSKKVLEDKGIDIVNLDNNTEINNAFQAWNKLDSEVDLEKATPSEKAKVTKAWNKLTSLSNQIGAQAYEVISYKRAASAATPTAEAAPSPAPAPAAEVAPTEVTISEEQVAKKPMTSEEIEAKRKQIAEENRKAKENAGENIKLSNFKRTKKRGQDLKIGDIYARKIDDTVFVFKVLSKLRKSRGQFYDMDVEILHIGNHVNRQWVGPLGEVGSWRRDVGKKTIDTFKNMSSGIGGFYFGEVNVLENFEEVSAPAPAPAPAPAETAAAEKTFEDKVVEQQSVDDLAKIINDAIKAKLTKAQVVDILVKRGGLTDAEASQAYNDVKAKKSISITTTGKAPAATTTTVKPKTKFVDGIVNAIEQMLGGNMSPEVKDAITASINKGREAVRTAQITEREMKKQLVDMLKDLTRKGTFTQKEVLPMMRRIAGLNVFNDSAVDNFVNFIVNKFETSEAKAKDREVRSKVKNARKNLKSKVGVARDAMPTLRRLFSLNPRIIPPSVRDAYNELVIEFGERAAVLSLDNINDVMVKADKILQAAINEQNQALLLKNAFDSFQNKVLDANGNIDYAKTIKQMIDDGVISTDDADIMTRQKKLIFESVSRKKTEAEIEAERVANIDTARNMSTDPSDIQTRDERNDAEEFIELINTDAVNNLTPSQAAMLPLILDNINNGWFPSVGKALIASMNGANAGNQLADIVMGRAKAGSIKKALSSVRAMFRKETSAIREYTRGKTLQYIDRALGIKDSRPIYNLVLKPIAEAYSSYKTSYKIVEQRIDKARNNVFKSLGRNGNKLIESSYKQMAYMLQREYLSNKGMKGVVPVVEILDATIKKLKKDNRYADAETLEQIKKDYVVNGEFDNDKLYNSFNTAEKKCIDVLSEINEELTDKAVYTASVIRGDASPMYRNYVHHDVLVDTNNPLQNYQAATSAHNPSTKAVSLIARTGGAKPLNFDAFSAVKRSSRNVLLDYNMTQTMRTVNKTLSTMADKVNSDPNVTKDQEQIASAIENNVKEVVEDVFMGAYNESTLVDDAIDYITKSGYRSMLAGVRSAAELISNFGAAMYNPKNFFKGVGIVRTSTDFNPVDVMMNVKSSEIERLYSSDPLSGKFVDSSSNTKAGARAEGKTNKVFNKINQIRDYTTRPLRNKFESLADVLISAPDKVVMRPHWFGTFASEFKKQAGVEPDFDKIAANDEAYMKQYKDAMNKARDRADKMSVFIGASDNPFKGILKNTVRDSDKGYIKTYKRFNAFMTRFLVFEYASARAAVTSLVGRGELSRGEGAALLGAITLRMIGYQFLYGILSEQFQNLIIEIFGGEKPEEDEKDGFEKLTQSTLSSIANLVIGRDLGNASKSILNYGVEQFNEAYLEDLRDGREYDKFKDNLVYSPIPLEMGKEGEGKKYGLDDAMISLSGPLSPLLRTTQKALDLLSQEERVDYYARERQVRNIEERIPLEILGHLGFIPFYKDLRGALIKDINKTLKFDESGGGGITKDELKKYDPDYYQEIYGDEDEANAEDAEAKELKEQEKADRDELLKEIYGEG